LLEGIFTLVTGHKDIIPGTTHVKWK